MNCIVVFQKDKDGIISHCGEIDFKSLKPREELFNLKCINEAGEYEAAT